MVRPRVAAASAPAGGGDTDGSCLPRARQALPRRPVRDGTGAKPPPRRGWTAPPPEGTRVGAHQRARARSSPGVDGAAARGDAGGNRCPVLSRIASSSTPTRPSSTTTPQPWRCSCGAPTASKCSGSRWSPGTTPSRRGPSTCCTCWSWWGRPTSRSTSARALPSSTPRSGRPATRRDGGRSRSRVPSTRDPTWARRTGDGSPPSVPDRRTRRHSSSTPSSDGPTRSPSWPSVP